MKLILYLFSYKSVNSEIIKYKCHKIRILTKKGGLYKFIESLEN